ncbi:MAG: SCO family protein [Planctomycetota bacterium]|nr:SCO family protein [Planctomycetaceae bacterium]MDQ3330056.1 SCO family protein [Planctomycetota bacterium]
MRLWIGRTIASVAAALLLASGSLRAESAILEAQPEELKNVGVDEHLDAQLPLDAAFRNEDGQIVRLGDYFKRGTPVILSLNYSNCPMLCNTQLTGLTEGLREIEWVSGQEFQIVSVSIDPSEQPHRALETRQKYLRLYRRSRDGWNFLVGGRGSIERVAEAVGFRYKYLPAKREYSHPAVAVLCTPDGRISRYLYGVRFPEQTLRLSLVEASEGKIGTAGDQLLLYCFHYDPLTGTYAPRAARIAMSVGCCLTVALLAGGLAMLWSRDASSLTIEASTELHHPTNAD